MLLFEETPSRREVNDRIRAQEKHESADDPKYPRRHLLRSLGDGNAPREAESPEPIGEVIDARGNPENIDQGNDGNSGHGRGHLLAQLRIEILGSHRAPEFWPPEASHVENDKSKRKKAGDALQGICPIARSAVFRDVGPRLERQFHAIKPVEQKREENQPPLERPQIRHVVDFLYGRVELLSSSKRLGVCPQVKHHEAADRHDASQRVQLAQQKRATVLSKERLIFRC